MYVRISALAALGLISCVDAPGAPEAAPPTTQVQRAVAAKRISHADAIVGRYIVVLDAQPAARGAGAALDEQIDRLATRHAARVGHRYASVMRGFAAEMTADAAAALAADPGVAYVEQDTPVVASAVQTNPTYGLDRIDQPSLPLDGKYTFASDGAGATVFVIDTGVNPTHVEFTGHLRTDQGTSMIDDGNGVEDCNGHGTHVSGTVAGTVFGVAKKATIVPVRVLDCEGSGASSGVIAGMDFVAQHHPARSVVNMSLGGAASDAEDAAVRNLVASGVTVVVAAGNEMQDACKGSPAREPMAITVASSTSGDARSSFSNVGTCVDLFAPGSGITSAWIDSDTATNTISGTSMASPHVAGAAALYLSANPNATPAQVTAALLGSAAQNKLADVQGSPNKLLQTNLSAPPPSGGVKITSPADGASVASTFEVTVAAANAAKVELALDGVVIAADQAAPFAFKVNAAPAGMHQLTAQATDAAGQATTTTIAVTVASPVLGGGGTTPLPVPMRRAHDGGCATAPGGALGPALLVLGLGLSRRRRRGRSASQSRAGARPGRRGTSPPRPARSYRRTERAASDSRRSRA
jgi:subtilisin family serine protease